MKNQSEDLADQLGRYLMRVGFTQQELANKIGMHRNTIVKWMNRSSWPTSRGQVLRTADELSLSKQERKAFIQAAGFSLERWPTEVWAVPQQRDMFFTGREDVIQSLRELLVPGSTTALTQAISGLGGIGKTHTAVEYTYRFHRDYEAVLWLQADSWDILISAIIKLADELGLPEQKETEQIVVEVQRWLRKHRGWLLILDNVENPQEILPNFVPTDHQGCVLITTRVHNVEPLAQTQMLTTMSEQEGVLFLLRRTTRIAAKAELGKASSEQYDEAKQIWQLLDGLPLALDQAGAYILETGCSFVSYQEQYARRRAELLPRRGKRFIGHEASVATTFSLTFERIEALNPVAADILRVCSLLHSEAIPEELFQEGADHLGPRLATERERWNLAVGVFQEYSLVQRNTEAKTLSVHRLVQAVLQDTMSVSEQQGWNERIVAALDTIFPEVEPTVWSRCASLIPHALICTSRTQSWNQTKLDLASLLFKTASYLASRAQYSEAEPLYLRALHTREKMLGLEHPLVAYPLIGIADLYVEQGKYEEAESLYQRALHIREQALGPEHLLVATSLNNLARLYSEQSKYAEAELLYQRAIHIRERASGPEDPQIAYPLSNLARLYSEQGKYAEAEPLYQRAIHIMEQTWGSHPLIAGASNNLAIMYKEQGKYEAAEPLYRRALHLWEETLGPEHPQVATPLINLGNLYSRQGKYAEAEPLYQRALHIREQALGPEHHRMAYPLTDLAELYFRQGKYAEAEPLYQRALHIREQVLGPEHPQVAYPLMGLAKLYFEQGKYAEAESLYQRALHIREQAWGPWHYEVADLLTGLAQLYFEQGKYTEAESLYQRALHVSEQALGPDHSDVAYPLNGLANLYYKRGKYSEAKPLYQRAIAIREHHLGPRHPETAASLHDFAAFQYALGNVREAKSLYERTLAIREEPLGSHHPKTVETQKCYATILRETGQQDEQ